MTFIDDNNILVLEKGGQVRLVSNGVLQTKPVLQVTVDTESERGLLGIAVMNSSNPSSSNNNTSINKNNNNNNKFVFLYYTESIGGGTDFEIEFINIHGMNKINPLTILF